MRNNGSENLADSTSDSFFHAMIDHAPVACFLYDKDFNAIDCNQHALTLFGNDSKAEQNLGNLDESFPKYQPDGELSLEVVDKMVRTTFEKGFTKFPLLFNSRTGRQMPCEVTLIRVEHQGEPAIIVYLRETAEDFDFTKHAKVERQRFKAMLDASPVICAIFEKSFDVEGGYNILETNQAAADLFELPDKRIYIERFFDLSPEYQPDGTASKDKNLKVLKLAFDEGDAQTEWMHQTLEGAPIPCDVRLKRVQLGEAEVVIAYIRDLRDYYKSREAEEAERLRVQAMINSSPLACFVVDESLSVLDLNQKTVELFGAQSKESFINNFFNAVPEYQPDGTLSVQKMRELFSIIAIHDYIHFDWLGQTFDGEMFPCEVQGTSFINNNDKKLAIVHVRDLRDVIKYKETNERARLMADAMPLIVEYWDANFNILDCNQTALNYYKYSSKKEYLDNPKDGFYSWDCLHELLGLAFKLGSASVTYEDVQPDGSVIHFTTDAVRVRNNNEFVVVTYTQDITPLNIDTLTGIPNRRKFSSYLDDEWARAIRNGTSLSLIMADIDDFKQLNDTYGHLQGDVALIKVARVISECVRRKIDMVARWGGEEFVALLPDSDLEGALKVAEKIRSSVENTDIPNASGNDHKITISLGVNTIKPSHGSEIEKFLFETDMALYSAKKSGKNTVGQSGGISL